MEKVSKALQLLAVSWIGVAVVTTVAQLGNFT